MITLLDPLNRIQALLRADDAQATPRARAFADDVFGAGGRAERMTPKVPEMEGIIEEDTGMKLQRAKTRVLLGKPDDDVFELAEQFDIQGESVRVDCSRWRGGDGLPSGHR
jgi:hypothetical protein